MRALLFSIMIMSLVLNQLSAQIKLNDVNCYNLGDGRYYCQEIKSKKPLEGSVRLIDGVSTQYIEAVYKKGIPDGSWKKFKYNVLVEECTYKDGILHGAYIEYYADGSKKLEQYFVNGKAEGKFLYYGSNDKIEREVNYKDGQQDGADISYDRDGNIQSTTFYSAGKETGLKKQLYSDYELTANYIDGKYDGDYSEIYTNGNVKVTGGRYITRHTRYRNRSSIYTQQE